MISETMPLNKWPVTMLESLLVDLNATRDLYKRWNQEFESTNQFIEVVKQAIKDQEFEVDTISNLIPDITSLTEVEIKEVVKNETFINRKL